MKSFYEPTQEQLASLDCEWMASYSGGKDSTSLVTWLEWLRRAGWISPKRPSLVMSDTGIEYPFLAEISDSVLSLLRGCGWDCEVVRPPIHKRFYTIIFGRGQPPVRPSFRKKMRWCTNATKVEPMTRFRKASGRSSLTLTGMRWGESGIRDDKMKASGCVAGGECGIPQEGAGLYSPIVNWTTCHVVDWLTGAVAKEVREVMGDVYAVTSKLVTAYNVRKGDTGFGLIPPKISALRFGCLGCPAVDPTNKTLRHVSGRNSRFKHVLRIYGIWAEVDKSENRVFGRRGGKEVRGPIKMEARKVLFTKLMDVQTKLGVILVTPEEEAFIRKCWEDKVYPRGWSEADEAYRG